MRSRVEIFIKHSSVGTFPDAIKTHLGNLLLFSLAGGGLNAISLRQRWRGFDDLEQDGNRIRESEPIRKIEIASG